VVGPCEVFQLTRSPLCSAIAPPYKPSRIGGVVSRPDAEVRQ
jgi:hypothetical protein